MKQFFFLLFFAFSAASCEKEIDYLIPYEDPKITIDARIIAGDTIRALVGTSLYSLAQSGHIGADSLSQVFLYENGMLADTLLPVKLTTLRHRDSERDLYLYVSGYLPKTGHSYKVEAIRPGMETAYGSDILKEAVTIENYSYDTISYRLTLTFRDPPGYGDYYRIRFIHQPDSVDFPFGEYGAYFSTADPTIEFFDDLESFGIDIDFDSNGQNYGSIGYISDEYFDGKVKKLELTYLNDLYFSGGSGGGGANSFSFEVMRISGTYYRHERSKAAQIGGNPFIEPVPVFSNIKHGYGIVAGGSPATVLVR